MKPCIVISGSKSDLATQLLKELRDEYEYILIDSHPSRLKNGYHITCDISNGEYIEKAIANIISMNSLSIKGVINTAARPDYHSLSETPYEDMAAIVTTKALGYANVIKACLPYLSQNASIVNVSSVAAFSTRQDSGVMYAAANSAVIGMTKALSISNDLRKKARVNVVCPGGFLTKEYKTHNPDWQSRVKNKQVLQVSQVTSVIRYLLSDDSSGINGAELKIETGIGNVRACSSIW